jgi:tetratricopeptide (TPR) repeat protein
MYNSANPDMADPLRDQESAESRIEELLLAGLDHYFNGQYELAISVWTRVLFLDRSHARARAYNDRARGAIAERQREGEELLQTGAAAFHRGDAEGARRLLTSAVERGAQPDEALAMLDRLQRLAPVATPPHGDPIRPVHHPMHHSTAGARERRGIRAATLLLVLAIGLASGVLVMIAWSSGVFPWSPWPASRASAVLPDAPLPVPSASEVSLARARAWSSIGRLRDALSALDAIRPGDPLRPQADDLRAEIQRQLLAAARAATPTPK